MANIIKSSIPYKPPSTENLIEFMKIGLRKNSDHVLLVDSDSDRTWTGRQMELILSRLARYLIDDCCLKKGDVCSVYGLTNDFNVLLNLAVISAGGVAIFLNDKYRPRELLDTAKTTNCKFIISNEKLLKNCQETLKEIDGEIKVISCDQACDGFSNGCKLIGHLLDKTSQSHLYTCEQLIESTKVEVDKDFAVIQFSSGTTGKPKPIPRTHKNLCHLVASVDHEELMNLQPGEVIAGSLPVTHRPGLWALLACIHSGATFVLWTNWSDPIEALQIIEKYKVTIFSSSLPLLAMLGDVGIKNKDNYNVSSLKRIITSGAKIVRPELPQSLVDSFNLISLRQCFGMTESGWVFLIEDSLAKNNYLSVGHVCPSMEMVVLDRESGKSVGEGVKGEVAIKGPQIFPGYLTKDKNVFNRSDFTQDGWFRTGDQGYFNSDKLVYIEGRYKELLIFENGGRFFPNEIETVINEHESVEGVCVVKIDGNNPAFDTARAYVTLKEGQQATEAELLEFVSSRAYEIMLQGGIKILDKFPRLENGKVNKQALRDMK